MALIILFKFYFGDGCGNNFWGLIDDSYENLENLKNLDTILPEINFLFSNEIKNKNDNVKSNYKSLIFELINNIKTTTN